MFHRRLLFRLTVIFIVSLSFCGFATAAFEIVDHAARADSQKRATDFSITFNRPPDFDHLDEFDRPRNAFQYWYDSNPGGFEFAGDDISVIRGSELAFGGRLPIRDSLNPKNIEFAHAEGWGEERGSVPIDVADRTVTFTVAWSMLDEDDDRFSYRLFAFESGDLTSDVSSIAIPLPTSLATGLLMISLLVVGSLWRKLFGSR